MKLVSHLQFNGQCREAFERYAHILGGKLELVPFSGMNGNGLDAAWQDKVAHAWLQLGDQALMGSDAPPQYAQPMGGFSVSLHTESPDEARRVFKALEEGGQVTLPIGETSWSPCCGMLTDRFGTPWLINTHPVRQTP